MLLSPTTATRLSSTLRVPTALTSALTTLHQQRRGRASWRYDDVPVYAAWPNYKPHLTHRRHWHQPHTWGLQTMSRVRCVDNSQLGREAMAEGKPPKIIHVYSWKHGKKPHGAYAALGDRVLLSVKGEKTLGIVVGLKQNQLANVPRFDTNNVVLIDPSGNPLGTRIHAPVPNCIRQKLKKDSYKKGTDYTKLMSIATRLV